MLVERSFEVRILFIGLWTLADREGRVENRPKRIKLELFPYDDVDVSSMLNELAEDGFVRIYECAGKKVVQIENFLKHQTPHGTEKDSELPDENGEYTVHERTDKGYVTGKKRVNSTNQQNDNGKLTLNERNDSVGAEGVNTLNPDNLNPDKTPHTPQGGIDGIAEKPAKKQRTSGVKVTMAKWFDSIRENGEKAISDYKPVWDYADSVGLPRELVEVAWISFKAKYFDSSKTYIDWRAAFRDHVKGNYLKLWFWSDKDNQYRLTTAGIQADKAAEVAA